MRFKDKSVIITGGGGKIGKAYAVAFAKEGAKVALPDIVSADHVVKAVTDIGGSAISMACDVTDEKSVKAMVDETVKQFGTVDVLINNAAYFMTVWKGPFWEMTVDEFDKAMAVNVRGSWLCAKAAVPYMQKQNKGKIINISSNVALTGNPNYIHYVTSKGAIIAMTRCDGAGTWRFQHQCEYRQPGLRRHRRTQGRSRIRKNSRSATQHQALSDRRRPGRYRLISGIARQRLHDRTTIECRRRISFYLMRTTILTQALSW